MRELPTLAVSLGLNPDTLKAQVQRQIDARMAARARAGDSAQARAGAGAAAAGGAGGQGGRRWRGGGANGAAGGAPGGFGGRGPGGVGAGGSGGGVGAGFGGGAGGGFGSGGPAGADPAGSGVSRAARAQLVMVQTPHGLEPRLVRTGISDFDYCEVVSGVAEGDQVALLSVAEQIAKRKQQQAQIAQRVGSGMPGSTTTSGGRGGGGGGGR
jgi:hypothetical protein